MSNKENMVLQTNVQNQSDAEAVPKEKRKEDAEEALYLTRV